MQDPRPSPFKHLHAVLFFASVSLIAVGCSSAKKRPENEARLSDFAGKKIAIIEITGETTGQRIAEVALINQIRKRGTFVLVSKKDVSTARVAFDQDPTARLEIAKRAGADLALVMDVRRFSAEVRKGFDRNREYDSQMAEDRGENEAEVDRLIPVHTMEGEVQFDLAFMPVDGSEPKQGEAAASRSITERAKDAAIHLPPKLRFLEELSNEAFEKYFEQQE